jgi:hypothetical protein
VRGGLQPSLARDRNVRDRTVSALGGNLARSIQFTGEGVLTVKRIFELANRAHFLYLTRNSAERGQLLKSVLWNCATDGVNLIPTYRKPFDLIFQRVKTEDWSAM